MKLSNNEDCGLGEGLDLGLNVQNSKPSQPIQSFFPKRKVSRHISLRKPYFFLMPAVSLFFRDNEATNRDSETRTEKPVPILAPSMKHKFSAISCNMHSELIPRKRHSDLYLLA